MCSQRCGTRPPDTGLGLSPAFHFIFGLRQGIWDRDENLGLFFIVHSILGNFCRGTWQKRDVGEGRVERKRSLLGSFAFSAKNGGSSVFPLKIASPLSRPPTQRIWRLGEMRHGSWTSPTCVERSGSSQIDTFMGHRAGSGSGPGCWL